MKKKVLITGGAGYIGSHTCVELFAAGFEPIVIDNLCNSKMEAIRRVEKISGRTVTFYKADIRDRRMLDSILAEHAVCGVIHFAGLKAVGESVQIPLDYYDVNVSGSLVLFAAMASAHVTNLVFSSSATVYGDPHAVPIREDFPLSATNPYGRSKLMVEDILRDAYQSNDRWRIALLRYFNPVGAHASGLMGEDPNGIPNNLMPVVSQVAVGKRKVLSVFGRDYATVDGTGVRDYIHVVDLAIGHIHALNRLISAPGLLTVNLGTGNGYSVLQLVKAFETASGCAIPVEFVDRRPGDVAACFADPGLARRLLGWEATRRLDQMCADAWRWQKGNPAGYES